LKAWAATACEGAALLPWSFNRDWIAEKRLLGWQATSRGPVIPAEQILGPRRVIAGLPQLLEIIPDPAVAWDLLRQESVFLDPRSDRSMPSRKGGSPRWQPPRSHTVPPSRNEATQVVQC
jgi:hypothetical protein